jgi:hypothetical protein
VEQIDQQRIEIHEIVCVVLGREPHQVGDGLVRPIQQGPQEPLIDRDISMRGSFQELIGGNLGVAFRLQNQIGTWQETTLLL